MGWRGLVPSSSNSLIIDNHVHDLDCNLTMQSMQSSVPERTAQLSFLDYPTPSFLTSTLPSHITSTARKSPSRLLGSPLPDNVIKSKGRDRCVSDVGITSPLREKETTERQVPKRLRSVEKGCPWPLEPRQVITLGISHPVGMMEGDEGGSTPLGRKRQTRGNLQNTPSGLLSCERRGSVFGLQDLCLRIHQGNAPSRAKINALFDCAAPTAIESDDHLSRSIARAIQQLSLRLMPDTPLTEEEVYQLWEDATAAEKSLLTLEKAIESAGGFEFPADIAVSDMQKFEAVDWDFSALARLRINELPVDRLNEAAILAHIDPADPNREDLITISRGVRVVVKPDFVPNKTPPPLRQKYKSLQSPLNKSIYKNYLNGKTIILHRDALVHIPDAHFSLVHCNLEPGKLRLITDSSNAPEGTHPLNSEYVKDKAKETWGRINPVTIETLIVKIFTYMLENPGEELELFKMDMADAFSLFTMHADDVHLLGFLLTNDLIQFEITGSFGKTDYPYVFNVFTLVVRREATKRVVQAILDMYVDDIMGISASGARLSDNLQKIKVFVESVWGKGSISDTKTLRSLRSLDMIGYEVDIIDKVVRMSQSNRYKTIRVLSRVKEEEGIAVIDIMRIASYATRYTRICLVMAPFTCHIYNALMWRTSTNTSYVVPGTSLSRMCKWTIQLWRCIITFMELRRDDTRFFRTFASFMPQLDSYFQIEFDASLNGAGVIVSQWHTDKWVVARVLQLHYSYELSTLTFQSAYQNTCEFIAATIGLVWAIKLGARNGHVRLLGDSKSALRWAETWKFRCGPSNNAAIVYVALGLKYNLRLDDIQFVRGVDNTTCDRLSRDVHPSVLGFDRSLYSDEEDVDMTRLLVLCTPSNDSAPSDDIVTKWVEAASYADSLESPFEL